jgi:cytochrome bd-type quinol oxidase subunit 2
MTVLEGPAGYLPVIAVLALLITREFARELHPVATPGEHRKWSAVTFSAAFVAIAILALRFGTLYA